VAPGALRRTWTEGGRRYFQYATSAPIGGGYTFHSARYAVREAAWRDTSAGPGEGVSIQVFHHPGHTENADAMVRSVQASLDYYTRQFGPYRYRHLWLLEGPGNGVGMHAEPSHLLYSEGFATWRASGGPWALDLPFAVVAHEVAHQFQPRYAPVEGGLLLSESFAWYAAMRVVEKAQGPARLRRLLTFMRQPYPYQPIRSGVPLLRARDPYAAYRKGPFALYALSEYVGEERVNGALRRVREAHGPGAPVLATSLDLYRELQAATPDSLRYLLRDLFEANTFWEVDTERAAAEQTPERAWRVTLNVRARKVVVDSAGVETEAPMNDWVQIGIFAPGQGADELAEPLYVGMHRVRPGQQTITVTVPRRPVLAGIDPYHLLDLVELGDDDNIAAVEAPPGSD
jgi:ABC-2 type transport system permease protein